MPLSPTRPLFSAPAQPSALVGVPAGFVAGMAYLAAQSFVAIAAGGTGSEPFQRIAAILLGPDAVSPSVWTMRAVGMALLIHLALSVVYGRIFDVLVMRVTRLGWGALLGGAGGAALFVVNRLLIAPHVFPWFDASSTAQTAADHVLFGVVAGVLCVTLRRHFGLQGRV